jgi:hypothetical protein
MTMTKRVLNAMTRLLPFLLALMFADLAVASSTNDQQKVPAGRPYKTAIEYIENTSNLWGIASVTLHVDGSVTLVDATNSGFGYGLMLFAAERTRQDLVTLKKGESCSLSDGDHAFLSYTFKGLNSEKQMVFIVVERFDARSFGDGIKEQTKELVVIQYGDGRATPIAPGNKTTTNSGTNQAVTDTVVQAMKIYRMSLPSRTRIRNSHQEVLKSPLSAQKASPTIGAQDISSTHTPYRI